MQIRKVEIRKLALPLIHSFSLGEIAQKEAVIVKLNTADWLTGYGEVSTLFTPSY